MTVKELIEDLKDVPETYEVVDIEYGFPVDSILIYPKEKFISIG